MEHITIRAEVAGTVWKIAVEAAEAVQAVQDLLIVESMKMEIPASAPRGGVVRTILVEQGQAITEGHDLLIIECT